MPPPLTCTFTSHRYPMRQVDWPRRGAGQLLKQMGLLPVEPPPTSRHEEPEGHAVPLQLAEHAPPGQPVG